MADNLCYIKTKNGLKRREKKQRIITGIKDKILSIHNHNSLRQNGTIDPELILMVCNCVENVIKKHAGVDKMGLVIEILQDIFQGLSHQEIENIKSQIQYNFDNQLIEVIPVLTKLGSILWNYIKRKLG